jgi:glycerol-3-phosphate dehydrogenase
MPALNSGRPTVRLSKGVHLVLPALPGSDAYLLPAAAGGRVVFLLPWHGRTLVGTTDTAYTGPPGQAHAEPQDVAELLAAANRVLAGAPWSEADIISHFTGVRTLPDTGAAASAAITREFRLHDAGDGLLTPVGGKLTSARHDAAAIVDRIYRCLGRTVVPCATAHRALPWAPPDAPGWWQEKAAAGQALGLDRDTAHGILQRLGTQVDQLHALLAQRPDLARRLVAGAPFCRGEILHAARHEMAQNLVDILRRRLPLLLVAPPSGAEAADAALLAGEALGWDSTRRAAEIRTVIAHTGAPVELHAGR